MNRTLDQLRYIEKYESWEGSLEVKTKLENSHYDEPGLIRNRWISGLF